MTTYAVYAALGALLGGAAGGPELAARGAGVGAMFGMIVASQWVDVRKGATPEARAWRWFEPGAAVIGGIVVMLGLLMMLARVP